MKFLGICRCAAALITALGCIALMSGCWDTAEINGRAFVLGFGADTAGDGNYEFTFQLAVPVSGSSDSSDAIEYVNCTVTDKSVASAIRSLEKNMGRQINFEQLTAIIIGEDLSHENFIHVTELFFRRASVRRQSCVAVCTGTAKDFLSTSASGKSISSDTAISLQSYDTRSGTGSMVMNLYSLYTAVSNRDGFYLMKISAVNPNKLQGDLTQDKKSDISPTEDGKQALEISGTASYSRDGEYLGELGGRELEILRLISNRQTGGIIAAAGTGEDDSSRIYYQIKQSHCSRECRVSGDLVEFTVNLDLQCSLVDGYGLNSGDVSSSEFTDFAEACIINALCDEIGELSERSRSELGASVMGLQDTLRQREPNWYEEHNEDWEKIYSRSKIKINVSCEVVGGGLTQ